MSKKDIVIEFVMNNIQTGKYKEGSKIMSESLMSEYLNVSRYTVRDALKILEEKGILKKVHGSGNYIQNIDNSLKYIVITINEEKISKDKIQFYIRLLDELKDLINKKGYIPYVNVEKSPHLNIKKNKNTKIEDYLSIDLSEIAGIISIDGNKDLYKSAANKGIPIVGMGNPLFPYPNVCMNQWRYFGTLARTVKKHKFRKVFIFSMSIYDSFIWKEFEKVGINYEFFDIDLAKNTDETYKKLKKSIKKIKNDTDLIVFADDNLYNACVPLFSENIIFKKAKIITHSNNNEIYPGGYSICRFTYFTEDFANALFDMTETLIKKQLPKEVNKFIDFTIIDEEVLK